VSNGSVVVCVSIYHISMLHALGTRFFWPENTSIVRGHDFDFNFRILIASYFFLFLYSLLFKPYNMFEHDE